MSTRIAMNDISFDAPANMRVITAVRLYVCAFCIERSSEYEHTHTHTHINRNKRRRHSHTRSREVHFVARLVLISSCEWLCECGAHSSFTQRHSRETSQKPFSVSLTSAVE